MAEEKKRKKVWANRLRSQTDQIEHVADAELESFTSDQSPDVDQTPIAQVEADAPVLDAMQQKRKKRMMSIVKERPNEGTSNDNRYTDVILFGVVLMAITSIVAGLLGFINAQTSGIIAQYEDEKRQTVLQSIFPNADEFKDASNVTTDDFAYSNENVNAVYIAYLNNEVLGYCVSVESIGYSSTPMELMVGSDVMNKITAIQVISHAETPGLGEALISNNAEFFQQFIGHTKPIEYSNQITAVSGATFTSNGIKSGANTALMAVDEVRLNMAQAGEGE